MSDATDKLCAMLDGLGVEHLDRGGSGEFRTTTWLANGVQWTYAEFNGETVLSMNHGWRGCQPEQAVAATLGNDDYEAKMDALLCRLTNGKWSNSRSYDLEFMVSCVDEEYETLYARELTEQESGTCDAVRDILQRAFGDCLLQADASFMLDYDYSEIIAKYADELNAALGGKKAKAHPYGYEPDTGAFDVTRCECGCLNDISATYCNDCGGEIEIDMNAEKEIYHAPRNSVFAVKHDDGSIEFGGKRYVAATLGSDRERALESLLRDWKACDPRCTNRTCADCEHDVDDGCDLMTRARELGIEV